jgi:hypothetical protein
MKNRIENLFIALKSIGSSESKRVLMLMKKSTPLEGHFPIRTGEPTDIYYGDDKKEVFNKETGEYEVVDKDQFKWDSVERPVGIKRDSRERVNISAEEDIGNWIDSIKFLRDKVILIPFDWDELDDDMIYAIGRIFGAPEVYDYIKLKDYISYFGGRSQYKEGDRDILKNIFPALWSDIASLLDSKGIRQEEALYILYNQKNTPGRLSDFSRGPHWLAHDIGHNLFDSEDGDPHFKIILANCMINVLKNYINDDGDSADSAFDDDPEEITIIAHEFLGPVMQSSYESGSNDVPGDIFAAVTSGKIFSQVPDYIETPNNDEFTLKDGAEGVVKTELERCIKEMKKYVSGDESDPTGPFSHLSGSVVLFDI